MIFQQWIAAIFHKKPYQRPTRKQAFKYWQADSTLAGSAYEFKLDKSKTFITVESTRKDDVRIYSLRELKIFVVSPYVPDRVKKMFNAALAFARENGAAI